MMESNFYSDDFERLIREKTEQYKMYPSEKAWKGVYSSLHTRKRWFIGGMAVLVAGIIVVAGKELILPSAHPGSLKKQPLTASLMNSKTISENTVLPAPFTEFKVGNRSSSSIHNGRDLLQLTDVALTSGEISGIENPDELILDEHPADPAAGISQPLDRASASTLAVDHSTSKMDIPGAVIHGNDRGYSFHAANDRSAESYTAFLSRIRTGSGLAFHEDPYSYAPMVFVRFASNSGNPQSPGILIPLHSAYSNRFMSPLNATELIEPAKPGEEDDDLITEPDSSNYIPGQKSNWLQDYAVYNMHVIPRKNKIYWQMYITPDENVRMLSGAPVYSQKLGAPVTPVPQTSGSNGFNGFLRNMGFATGVALIYKISPSISVKGGLQFNYSRFAVNPPPGSIAGSSQQRPISNPGSPQDSLGIAAGAITPGGQSAQTIYNEYFQLSAPVGLELRIWGNDRLQVNVAATVQPAYMLNSNAWLLSSEGNSYTQSPSMFRKWNIDGGAEAYVSYKIGGFRLQAGPDFRYQFLSSYVRQFPIRENLASYGLKIGVVKAIR